MVAARGSDGGGRDDRPEGAPAKRPGEQEDPDQYVRVVERRPDGVVIRGAKFHNTGGINFA